MVIEHVIAIGKFDRNTSTIFYHYAPSVYVHIAHPQNAIGQEKHCKNLHGANFSEPTRGTLSL